MTESEWNSSTLPRRMLSAHSARISDRKLRLFAVAAVRRIWDLVDDDRSRRAVEVVEAYADRLVLSEAVEDSEYAAEAASQAALYHSAEFPSYETACSFSARIAAVDCCRFPPQPISVAKNPSDARGFSGLSRTDGGSRVFPDEDTLLATANADPRRLSFFHDEEAAQAELLRDIVGYPLITVSIEPDWLSWNSDAIPKIAQAIYEERAFERMSVLADALEEAGCQSAEILAHCRGPSPHARGCWVLDLLLLNEDY